MAPPAAPMPLPLYTKFIDTMWAIKTFREVKWRVNRDGESLHMINFLVDIEAQSQNYLDTYEALIPL